MTDAPVRAFVALGGNLGDVAATFAGALSALDGLPGTTVRARSALYRNPPLVDAAHDAAAQPEFLNAVAELATTLAAPALLEALLAIERDFGRERAPGQRWAPRTLDLDLLLYGDARIDAPGLCVPHPALHERAFVLVPLAELDPQLRIPGHGPVRALLEAVDSSALEALP
jgi:2-amino-4-hydroxy-6-hydroxymethyldihydropteridine diphosphokinase